MNPAIFHDFIIFYNISIFKTLINSIFIILYTAIYIQTTNHYVGIDNNIRNFEFQLSPKINNVRGY